MSQPNNNNQITTAAADNNNTASPVASLAATIPHVRSTSLGSHDSRSMSGSTTGGGGGGGGTTPGGGSTGGPGSIQTTGSGSLTGSPLPSPRDYPSAAAVTAAKSAAIVAAASGGVLPPPWPETSTSSPPTGTTTSSQQQQQQQQHPPAIPILRNTSQNSAASTATPGLTQSISTEADTNTIISSGDKTLPSTTANTTSTATTSTAAKTNNISSSSSSNIVPTASASVDSSVLLGLEELERQQYAHAEKKKAEQWKLEMTTKQQQQQQQQVQQQQQPSRSLPPLAPSPASGPAKITPVQFSSSQQQQQIQQQRQIMLQQQYSNNPNQPPPPPPNQHQQQQYQYNSQQQQLYYQNQQQQQQHQQQLPNNQQQPPPRASPPNVPSQIHLSSQYGYDTDDPSAALSSIENRSKEDTSTQTNSNSISSNNMKRVTSIEKFQKSAQNTLRRFRSWSQDQSSGGNNNNGGGGGGNGGGGGGGLRFSSPPTIKSRGKSPPPPSNNEILGTPGLQPTPTKQHQSSSSRQQQQQHQPQPSGTVWDEDELTPLIYGYLHKLGRNGHWQKRFFETNGERLTYYKSGKRTKVLATLDLCKVGEIAIDKTDPEECTFTIQVSNRPYYLRAEDKARCNDWVIILNRAREARHGWGNIQLVNPTVDDVVGAGGRSQAGSDEFGPCIVISALRPRTQAVNYGNDDDAAAGLFPPDLLYSGGDDGGAAGGGNEEHEQIEVLDGRDPQQQLFMMQQQQQQLQLQMEDSEHMMMGQSQLQGGQQGDQPMAKWQKRHSALHHFSMRLLNWARSITSNADACRRQKDVVVVPAHVMRSMMSQAVAASASGEQSQGGAETAVATVPPGSIHVTRPSVSGKPGLQDVVEVSRSEEMSQSNEASDSGRERKRTESSDSPAFGMGSSQYV